MISWDEDLMPAYLSGDAFAFGNEFTESNPWIADSDVPGIDLASQQHVNSTLSDSQGMDQATPYTDAGNSLLGEDAAFGTETNPESLAKAGGGAIPLIPAPTVPGQVSPARANALPAQQHQPQQEDPFLAIFRDSLPKDAQPLNATQTTLQEAVNDVSSSIASVYPDVGLDGGSSYPSVCSDYLGNSGGSGLGGHALAGNVVDSQSLTAQTMFGPRGSAFNAIEHSGWQLDGTFDMDFPLISQPTIGLAPSTAVYPSNPMVATSYPRSLSSAQASGMHQENIQLPGETSCAEPRRHPTELVRSDGRPLLKFPGTRSAMKAEDFAKYYEPLPETPRAWGIWPNQVDPLFSYTRYGEWQAKLTFDENQLRYYMEQRRLAGRPLTIWVQNQPSQCKKRFPNQVVGKCRWKECGDVGRTIAKGDYQITFDEQPELTGSRHDPFHNAGYMHLFCFEKCFDLQEIKANFNLEPDCREFAREARNPFALNRDGEQFHEEFWKWHVDENPAYQLHADKQGTGRLKRRQVPQDNRLCARLTKLKLLQSTPGRAIMRQKRSEDSQARNGLDTSVSIDKHLGDLDVRRQMKAKVKKAKSEAQKQSNLHIAKMRDAKDSIRVNTGGSPSSRSATLPGLASQKRQREEDDDEFRPKRACRGIASPSAENDSPSSSRREPLVRAAKRGRTVDDNDSDGDDDAEADQRQRQRKRVRFEPAPVSPETITAQDSIAGRVLGQRRISTAMQKQETARLVKTNPYAVEQVLKACLVDTRQISELLNGHHTGRRYGMSI